MKRIFPALTGVLVITVCVAAKVPNAQIVDSGSFGIYIKGQRVATETFKIEQSTSSSMIKSELKAQDGAAQRSQMELSPSGNIVRYDWQEIQPVKATVAVFPKDEFLTETINTGPNEKAFTIPHLLPTSTPIVDDNFFLHREVLMWRFLAAQCVSKDNGLSCKGEPQQFGVLIPAQHASETVTIGFKDQEKISVKGKEVECSTFHLKTETADWLVFLDHQQKLVRILAEDAGLEVLRD
ncbi:MAG: hypothetical protein JOZ10_00020 [Acidobacteria bacterium]|nr:hypothetical protein [Acidobacteriota bacterium]MBV9144510.1 hypothetical protein [Acidobacteriota bacterium]MBV9434553.1 hypothetical protein [Acidobacteriota bacterium]